jgi:hypothetical protein
MELGEPSVAITTASTGRFAMLSAVRGAAEGQTVSEGALAASLSPTKTPTLATVAPGAHSPIAGVVASASHEITPTPFIRCAGEGSTWIRAMLRTPDTL